jgi:hypothetical protein
MIAPNQFTDVTSADALPEQVYKLGNSSASPYGKNYRMRIRSKRSGRAVDVIFSFRQDIIQ